MTEQEKDISQIKKYLEGKLDARSMYELERRAQDDPFLLDALEGYENAGKPQDKNLKELTSRLKIRTEKKESRIIAMRFIAIAASVLLVLFAGLLWFILQRPSHQPQIAKVELSAPKRAADTLVPTTPKKNTEVAALIQPPPKSITSHHKYKTQTVIVSASADADVAAPVANTDKVFEQNAPAAVEYKKSNTLAKDSTPLNETVVMGYSAQQLNSKVAGVSSIAGKNITGMVRDANGPLGGVAVSINGTTMGTLTNSQGYFTLSKVPYKSTLDITYSGYDAKHIMIKKQDSLIIALQPVKNYALAEVVVTGYGAVKRKNITGSGSTITGKGIKGIVTDGSSPIAGATVQVKGTNISVVTDINGKFALPPVPNGSVLEVAFLGYERRDITAKKTDSLTIALQPNASSLSEVVVTGYSGEPQQSQARPSNGWDEFEKYLKENAISPDGKTGTVKVSFMVNTDNSLSNFKVIKGIRAKTDTAAIELIKNGPDWLKNSNNKPEKVKLRVKFEAKK
ncbi:TonB protein C-terminal [Mucilaginibacter mallensis]|uniref:TonB protein C-terminal n=1 Tax=Mucilaginibacter mallensis TaxID=652787 RepID=A0A1H2B9F9_MUCMA|nr:carboxypeptidase-like regulatory domain-containing protein [Mucilaginibacter mallensis]SDT54692.1 TonB protein C-terminal [Mucilaginibacter mallensis]